MDWFYIIAQGIGIIAMILSALSFQMDTRKKIIVMQILTSVVFSVHYLMLGNAMAAAVVNLIAIVRNVVIYYKEKLPLGSNFWVGLFCVIMAVAAYWSNPVAVSLLMSVGIVFNTLAVASTTPKNTRKIILISSPIMFVYNLIVFSIGGMINEAVVEILTIITLVRESIRESKKQ